MTFDEFEPLLRKVFPDEKNLNSMMKKADIESWDSISHLNLILEVEDSLGVIFEKSEIESIGSLTDLLNIINEKLKA